MLQNKLKINNTHRKRKTSKNKTYNWKIHSENTSLKQQNGVENISYERIKAKRNTKEKRNTKGHHIENIVVERCSQKNNERCCLNTKIKKIEMNETDEQKE